MPPQISGAYSRAVTGGGLHQELDQHCRIAEEDSDVAKELVVKPTCALTLTFYWKGEPPPGMSIPQCIILLNY
jgi:hypothetical protein